MNNRRWTGVRVCAVEAPQTSPETGLLMNRVTRDAGCVPGGPVFPNSGLCPDFAVSRKIG